MQRPEEPNTALVPSQMHLLGPEQLREEQELGSYSQNQRYRFISEEDALVTELRT